MRLNIPFGGIAPRFDKDTLPEQYAYIAHNCDLSGRVLKPQSKPSLSAPVGTVSVESIEKPEAVTLKSREYICKPQNWLTIKAWMFCIESQPDGSPSSQYRTWRVATANYSEIIPQEGSAVPTWCGRYTEQGLEIQFYSPLPVTVGMNAGFGYKIIGPLYQFVFAADADREYGGPAQAYGEPQFMSEGCPELPACQIPLERPDGTIYAIFQPVDVNGPKFNDSFFPQTNTAWEQPAFSSTIKVDLNYVRKKREQVIYVQSIVSDDQEGPPSEMSQKLIMMPGEKFVLNCADYTKIYRGGTEQQDDFRLIVDKSESWGIEVADYCDDPIGGAIPPYGRFTGASTALLHPGHFAVAFAGEELHFSEPYQLKVWPEEYVFGLGASIKKMALCGNTIVVFTGSNVYGITGGHPAHMARNLLSNVHPLSSTGAVATVDETVYWVTGTGIAATNGGKVELITEDLINPAAFSGASSLRYGGGALWWGGYKLDLAAHLLTTVDSMENSANSCTWQSARMHFDNRRAWEYARAIFDGDAPTISVNGISVVPDANGSLTDLSSLEPASSLSAKVVTSGTVTRLELLERVIHDLSEQPVVISRQNQPQFQRVRLKFQSKGVLAGFAVTAWPHTEQTVTIYDGDGDLITSYTGSLGYVHVTRERQATMWTLEFSAPNIITEIVAYPLRTEAVSGTVRLVNSDVAPWSYTTYEFPEPAYITSLYVHGKPNQELPDTLTVNMMTDSGMSAETLALTGSGEYVFATGPKKCTSFYLTVSGRLDYRIGEVIVNSVTPQIAGDNGANLGGGRSQFIQMPQYGYFVAGQIAALEYPVVLDLYNWDGGTRGTKTTVTVESAEPFEIPASQPAGLWEVDIVAPSTVIGACLRTPRHIEAQGAIVWHRTGDVPEWMYTTFSFQGKTLPACAQVVAEKYSNIVKLYGDGALHKSVSVSGPLLFTLGTTTQKTTWKLSLDHTKTVQQVTVIPWQTEAAADNVRMINSGAAPWLFTTYEFPQPVYLSSFFVHPKPNETLPATMTVKAKTTSGLVEKTITLGSAQEYVFSDGPLRCTAVQVAFPGAQDYRVAEVIVCNTTAQVASDLNIAGGISTRSQFIQVPQYGYFLAGQIAALEYPVTLDLYNWDSGTRGTKTTVTVESAEPFEIPAATPAGLWEVDIVAPSTVIGACLRTPRHIEAQGAIVWHRTGDVPEWMYTTFSFQGGVAPSGLQVVAESDSNIVKLYGDGALSKTVLVSSANPKNFLPPTVAANAWKLVLDHTKTVQQVTVWPLEVVSIGNEGFIQTGIPAGYAIHSKQLVFPESGAFDLVRVTASKYPMTFTLTAGTEAVSITIENDGDYVLSEMTPAKSFFMTLEGDPCEVSELVLIGRVITPIQNGTATLRRGSGPWSWQYKRLHSDVPVAFACARVQASAYPVTLKLTPGAGDPVVRTVTSADAFRLPVMRREHDIRLDLIVPDGVIVDEVSASTQMRGLGYG